MAGHHVIISGTGRAGTTFLMQVLTHLEFPTGFDNLDDGIFKNCNAGMEWDITRSDAPYIVKPPQLCDHLGRLVQEEVVVVDHAIVPVRQLSKAADSRIRVHRETDPTFKTPKVPGGLWDTDDPALQHWVLALKFHQIM